MLRKTRKVKKRGGSIMNAVRAWNRAAFHMNPNTKRVYKPHLELRPLYDLEYTINEIVRYNDKIYKLKKNIAKNELEIELRKEGKTGYEYQGTNDSLYRNGPIFGGINPVYTPIYIDYRLKKIEQMKLDIQSHNDTIEELKSHIQKIMLKKSELFQNFIYKKIIHYLKEIHRWRNIYIYNSDESHKINQIHLNIDLYDDILDKTLQLPNQFIVDMINYYEKYTDLKRDNLKLYTELIDPRTNPQSNN